jgi:hypothetical protein
MRRPAPEFEYSTCCSPGSFSMASSFAALDTLEGQPDPVLSGILRTIHVRLMIRSCLRLFDFNGEANNVSKNHNSAIIVR